jgi:hypothetical protein
MIDRMRRTWITTYYNNSNMLLRQLSEWEKYPYNARQLIRFIVVDDGSSFSALDVINHFSEHIGLITFDLALYRVKVDIPWNQDGCRNLAMKFCETEWAFLTDIDRLLPRDQVKDFLNFSPRAGTYYMPSQQLTNGTYLDAPHPNSFFMSKTDFWSMGGYDEDFAGYYGTDGNFRKCAKGAGLIEARTRAFKITKFTGADIADSRTTNYGRKDSHYAVANNADLLAKRNGPAYRASVPVRFPFERQM